MALFFIIEERWGVTKECIMGLHAVCEFTEGSVILLGHGVLLVTFLLFPIMSKVWSSLMKVEKLRAWTQAQSVTSQFCRRRSQMPATTFLTCLSSSTSLLSKYVRHVCSNSERTVGVTLPSR